MLKHSRLILGSANWGLGYGVGKNSAQLSMRTVKDITSQAASYGVGLIDTAPLYINSHEVIRDAELASFEVITKTMKFPAVTITYEHAKKLRSAFEKALEKLDRPKVHALLFHQASDLLKPGSGYLVDVVNELKSEGYIDKFGVSIYYSDEFKKVFQVLKPDIVQLPVSLFDQRFYKDGTITALSHQNVEIHARSIFLQGIPFLLPENLPKYFKPWQEFFQNFADDCKAQNLSPAAVCTSFVGSLKEIDRYVVGFDRKIEVDQFFRNLKLPFNEIFSQYECVDDNLINPIKWSI